MTQRFCKRCGELFQTYSGGTVKFCKRCKEKMLVVARLGKIKKSLNEVFEKEKDLSKKERWHKQITVILIQIGKSIDLLKKEGVAQRK